MSDLLERYVRPIRDSNDWFLRRANALPLAPGASEKYEADGTAKDLPGYSFVSFLGPANCVSQRLASFCARLRGRAERSGIAGKLALLPPETYHLTLADGIVWPDEHVRRTIRDETREVFGTIAAKGLRAADLADEGIGISAGISVVAWCVPRSEANSGRSTTS